MTTVTTPPRRAASLGTPRLTFGHLVRAEWIGLRSLRATTVLIVVGTVLGLAVSIGMAVLLLSLAGSAHPAGSAQPALGTALAASSMTQLIAVILGVSAYAKEHASGSLRAQLSVAPRRTAVLGAKAVVIGLSTFVWSLAVLLLALLGVLAVDVAWGVDPALGGVAEVFLPLLGSALFGALVGVLSLGVAAILRSESWSVTAVLVFLLVLPTVLLTLPFEWAPTVYDVLMTPAGEAFSTVHAQVDGEVLKDMAIAIAWPAAALIAGMAVMRRRDA